MKNNLENGAQYSRDELQSWFETRSRICSTPLWSKALQGRETFEVGAYTYSLKPTANDRYLLTYVETSTMIASKLQSRRKIRLRRLLLTIGLLVAVLSTCAYFLL